ncbi:apoptosis regulator BAX-like [Arapaima gigas]
MAEPTEGRRGGNYSDGILDIGVALLKDFIVDRVCRHGGQDFKITHSQLGGSELCDSSLKDLSQCLRQIGDDLDNHVELQRLIDNPNLKPTNEAFVQVACEIFSDGKYSWGRVVALFYFACRLVIKALIKKIPDIIQTIITWTVDYLRDHVVNWIRERGGWEDIRSYFGTPTWQMFGVFLAGVFTAILVVHKMG